MGDNRTIERGWLGIVYAVLVFSILSVLYNAGNALLLLFGGVVVAAALSGLSVSWSRLTGFAYGSSYTVTLLLLVCLAAAFGWFFARAIVQQYFELAEQLPQAFDQFRQQTASFVPWDRMLSLTENSGTGQQLLRKSLGIASTSVGALGSFALVLLVGIYLAANPVLYRSGLVRLVPLARRASVDATCQRLGTTLQWWLLGKLIAMTAVGVVTWIALGLLEVPLALSLAVLAALLDFIPNLGPVVAAVPAVLLGATQGIASVWWIVAVYTAVQFLESSIVSPIIQQRTISLPPALTIASQLILGSFYGVLGVALAAPAVAIVMVVIKEAYVENILEREVAG